MSENGPIVCGFDGSDQAHDALALTRILAQLLDADALSLSVLTLAPTEATYAVYERMLREEEARLVTEAREGLRGVSDVETVAIPGASPPRELHDLAESRGARLIVIGSTHRGRLGRVLPGTVADRLVAGAPCPIAVAPRGYREVDHPPASIAVAYDGSAESKVALRLASELATAAGARVALIAVANPREALTVAPGASGWAGMVSTPEGIEKVRERMESAVGAAIESLPDAVRTNPEVTVDIDPASVIVAASQTADLLVIGSRGYGPFRRVLLGGVSSAVLREAACPVIVTPRSTAGELEDARPSALDAEAASR
jgi:nucleotide-binding universal stress UspA family protein